MVELISKGIMFFVTVSIVRYFGPKEFGVYNLAFAYVSIFLIFSDFGLATITTRDVSKDRGKSEQYIANMLGIKLGLSLIITLLLLLCLLFFPPSVPKTLVLIALVYSLFENIGTIFTSIFSAWEKMKYVFLTRLSFYLGILVSTLGTVIVKGNSTELVCAYAISTVISLLVSSLFIRRMHLKIGITFEPLFIKKIARETIPFLGLAIVGTLYASNDTLFIGHFFGNESVGFYQSAYKILFAFQSINVINNALFPRINVLLHSNNHETLKKLLLLIIGGSLILLIPLATGITIFQKFIVGLIYGKAYLASSTVMALLVWGGVVNYFRVLSSNILFARNKQNYVFGGVTLGLIGNLVVNYFIMPRTSYVTAAWGLLGSELLILSVTTYFVVIKQRT